MRGTSWRRIWRVSCPAWRACAEASCRQPNRLVATETPEQARAMRRLARHGRDVGPVRGEPAMKVWERSHVVEGGARNQGQGLGGLCSDSALAAVVRLADPGRWHASCQLPSSLPCIRNVCRVVK